MTNTAATPSTHVDRAIAFVKGLLDRYVSYHSHKESMAFTGLTLFTGAGGAALVSDNWPPAAWGARADVWAWLAITALWFGVLAYLRFQLRRRRWAALRVAGCERLLAKWVVSLPSDADLLPKDREPIGSNSLVKFVDFFWPLKAAVLVMKSFSKDDPAMYPSALVDAWVSQEKRGTDALLHERLIVLAGWVLYLAVALFTVRACVV